MADFLLDTQGNPASPSAGTSVLYPDSGSLQWTSLDSNGRKLTLGGIVNYNTTDSVANAANTYLAGSSISVPQHLLQAGTVFRWRMAVTKSGAGTAAPIWTVVVGTAGTTADTARLTFTGVAQTAVIDTADIEIECILRNTGAAGVLAGVLTMNHNLAATGFANQGDQVIQVTSAGFTTSTASLKVGICVDPGASGVWTHQIVKAEMFNC